MMKSFVQGLRVAACGAVALALCGAASITAVAQPAVSSIGEILQLSSRLYEEGMARQDAILVFAAARLRLSQLPMETSAETPGWISGNTMLRTAEEMAVSEPALRTMIVRLGQETTRGGLNGPQVSSVTVQGKAEYRLPLAFAGGRPAYIYAEGAPGYPLSVTVLESQSQVCATPVEVSRVLCRWVAARDGPVTTIVRNHADTATTVLVVTN